LRAVRDIDDPAIARRVLVEMLETFGDDDGLLPRIMNAGPNADLPSLRVDRLVLRARVDPPGALQDALHMRDQGMRHRAARRIAAVWARQDPAGALREAGLIDDAGIRSSYTAAVMAE